MASPKWFIAFITIYVLVALFVSMSQGGFDTDSQGEVNNELLTILKIDVTAPQSIMPAVGALKTMVFLDHEIFDDSPELMTVKYVFFGGMMIWMIIVLWDMIAQVWNVFFNTLTRMLPL